MFGALMAMAGLKVGQAVRDGVRRAAYLFVVLIFLLFALGFGGVALFLWLAEMMSPALAAACVAGLALLVALIAILMANRGGRSEPAMSPAVVAGASAASFDHLADSARSAGAELGRKVKPVPLVLAAVAAGVLLGRILR